MQTHSRFWLSTLIVTGFIFGAFYFFQQQPTNSVASTPDAPATTSINTSTNLQHDAIVSAESNQSSHIQSSSVSNKLPPELQARMDAIHNRRPTFNYSPADVAAAAARVDSWKPATETPTELPLEPEEFTDGRQFIQLDTLKIETLIPGDLIKVRVAENGKDYSVVVDKVEKHDYNSISWHGHIEGDDGHKYSVSFTRGETLTVGGLDTPDGHYVLQAHGEKGWVASSQLLFKSDPNVSDAIHPADVDPNYAHTRDSHLHNH